MGCGTSKYENTTNLDKNVSFKEQDKKSDEETPVPSSNNSKGRRKSRNKSREKNRRSLRKRSRDSYKSRHSTERHPSTIYVALFDYKARSNKDISFSKGDLMELLDKKEGQDWVPTRHMISKTMGLVPSAYIARNGSLKSKDWFFGHMLRREAETLLLSDDNIVGTFMVRRSEQNKDVYSVSIKCYTDKKGVHAKHYRTRFHESNKFCLFPERYFESLIELIEFYSKHSDKLPTALIKPCKKPIPQLWDLAPDLVQQWEISKSELQLINKVGAGQFGEVWYGKWNKTIQVAIKTCKPDAMTAEEFLAEASIMKRYRHPRLVALYAVCTKESPIYIVTEYMINGSLLEHLKKHQSKIKFNHLIYIALQITEGMKYLESNILVHRDLAARNILIGENNSAKIADFGLARVMNRDAKSICDNKNELLPIKWCALEVIEKNEYSTKSDVWSFGIIMMELFTYGEKPYGDWTPTFTRYQLNKGFRIPKPEEMPEPLYETVFKCWHKEPMERPTFERLCEYFEAYSIGTEGHYQDEPEGKVNN